ncbi:MAG: DUF4347 domain-containing protein [Planctomycetes bacterium]|nr:DUF4347 domain-containing protein [Planctomycetota bacterium]
MNNDVSDNDRPRDVEKTSPKRNPDPSRRKVLRGALTAGGVLFTPRVLSASPVAALSPCPGSGQLVPEASAVYLPAIPPDFYSRDFLAVQNCYQIANATTVQVQPPEYLPNPYGYGTSADYCLFHNASTGIFTASFANEGIFHLLIDGFFKTIFVGSPIEEIPGGPKKTGCTESFAPSGADLVISDEVGIDYARNDYYQDELGQTMAHVTSVADALAKVTAHVAAHGKLKKLTIANHAAKGKISMGGGDAPTNAQLIGKDAVGGSVGSYNAFVAGMIGKFSADAEICLIGCNVGEDTAGQKFVDALVADIPNVTSAKAKKGAVSYPLRNYLTERYASSSGEKGWATN